MSLELTPSPLSSPATSAVPITPAEPSGASAQPSVQSAQGSQILLAGLLRRALRHCGLDEISLEDASIEEVFMVMLSYVPSSEDNYCRVLVNVLGQLAVLTGLLVLNHAFVLALSI